MKVGERMNIYKAVKKARKRKRFIARKKYRRTVLAGVKIKPTDSAECCIVFKNNKPSASRWNPSAEDLAAKDWIIVD